MMSKQMVVEHAAPSRQKFQHRGAAGSPRRCVRRPGRRHGSSTTTSRAGTAARRSRVLGGSPRRRSGAGLSPSSSKTGRSIQSKPGWNPLHQMTFATLERCDPSSSNGRPSRNTDDPRRALDACRREIRAFHPDQRAALGEDRRSRLAAERCVHRQHVVEHEADHERPEQVAPAEALRAETGTWPLSRPAIQVL